MSQSNPKTLLRAASIYGGGLAVNRVLDFALLPLFTNYLDPGEYGAVALTLTLLGFGHVVYAMGLGPAFLRYFAMHDEERRRRMFLAGTLTLFVVALAFSALMCGFAPVVGEWFGLGERRLLVDLAAGILFLDVLTLLPYSILRSEARAATFVACTFFTTVVQVGLTAGLILLAGMGGEAFFVAMVASSALNVLIVTISVRRYVSFAGPIVLPREVLRFGLPFVPAGVATVAIELIDRMFLERMMDAATVGVYSAGYRVAAGMGLLVKAFEYAWAPYVLERRDQVLRATTGAAAGFVGVAGLLWAGFILLGEEILGIRLFGKDLIGPAYRTGVVIIPPVMFAYILSGIAEVLMAGVYLKGRSWIVPVATLSAATVNIIGNLILIPAYGMTGAAWATIVAYAVLVGVLYLYTRRVFVRADKL